MFIMILLLTSMQKSEIINLQIIPSHRFLEVSSSTQPGCTGVPPRQVKLK